MLETTSWDADHHLIEIVFVGAERDRGAQPTQLEKGLAPLFLPLDDLDRIGLRPPIGGYVRGYARSRRPGEDQHRFTAPYLGNVWRPQEIHRVRALDVGRHGPPPRLA